MTNKANLFISVASGPITFGSKTLVGAGGKAINETDGPYGEFTVTDGIISPNTTPLTPGEVTVGSTTVLVEAGYATASSVAEIQAANVALRASGVPETVKIRNGIYRGIPFIQQLTPSNRITFTWQETLRGPVFYNIEPNRFDGSSLRSSDNSTWDGLTFRASPEFVEAKRKANRPDDTGVYTTFLWEDAGENIHIRNCAFNGPDQSDIILNNSEWVYPVYPDGTYAHVPTGLSFVNATGAVIEDNEFHNLNTTLFVALSDGTRIRRNYCRNIFSEGMLLSVGTAANGGTCIIEDHTVENVYGIYEETNANAGAQQDVPNHPHMDFIQLVPQPGQTPAAPVELVIRRAAGIRGNNRSGTGMQGIFDQGNQGMSRLIVDTCAVEMASTHGVTSTSIASVIVANSTFTYAGNAAATSPNFRSLNQSGEGKEMIAYNSLFQGIEQVAIQTTEGAPADGPTVENINTTYQFDLTKLSGAANSDTLAEMKANLSPLPGELVNQGAFVDGDWRPLAGGFPRPAAAPTVTDNGNGTVNVTRQVPSDLDGATVASYDLRHRVSANNAVWTHVENISSPEVVALATGTYEFQTRPRTTTGAPGFWSLKTEPISVA